MRAAAEGVPVQSDDVSVMDQPVARRGRHDVVAERLARRENAGFDVTITVPAMAQTRRTVVKHLGVDPGRFRS